MAGKLSAKAQVRMASLQIMVDKVQHVYGLVERYASSRDEKTAEHLTQPLKRAFGKLKLDLMGAGFDSMSQLAASMEIAAGRGGGLRTKARILREGVGSLKFQIEQEQRQVVSEDERERAKEAEAEHDGAPPP
jgi:hypothetical protein